MRIGRGKETAIELFIGTVRKWERRVTSAICELVDVSR